MIQDKTIVLQIFNEMAEANLVRDKLHANDIPSFIENENPIGLNPLGGLELKIFSRDKERAENIISE